MPAWLPPDLACGHCGAVSATGEAHGVICRRRRKNSALGGCGKGVCWACMESRPRAEFGMVRTTKEEFDSLEDKAWWMHEGCMESADLRAYFGGEKELARARALADAAEADAEASTTATASGGRPGKGAPVKPKDPAEAAKEKVNAMSVKELKAYLDKHKVSRTECVEKSELLAKALQVAATAPPEIPPGPAWMPVGSTCRLCTKPVAKEFGGVICRRRRADGAISGCGEAVCWRCMKKAPKDSFGQVRTTKEEFEELEEKAWWMHEGCFQEGDYKDYFGEDEPEDFWRRRTKAAPEEWEDATDKRPGVGKIMQRC